MVFQKGQKFSKAHKEKLSEIRRKWYRNTFIPKINSDFAYIMGVVFGDGWITKYKKSISKYAYSYTIGLDVTDKDFALAFKKALENWSGYKVHYGIRYCNPSKILGRKIKRMKPIYHRIAFHNKQAYYFIKKHNPTFFETLDLNLQKAFIKGFMDSEGSVTPANRIIQFNITNYNLMITIIKCFNNLGIVCGKISETKSKGFKTLYHSRLTSLGNLKKYQKLVGFTIERKAEKLKEMCSHKNITWKFKDES